jgi:predicted alpha/beta superfamily hydrolase
MIRTRWGARAAALLALGLPGRDAAAQIARAAPAPFVGAPAPAPVPARLSPSLSAPFSFTALAAPAPALAPASAAPALAAPARAAAAFEPAPPPDPARAPAAAGAPDVRLIRDFASAALDNRRTVAVYLPPGYDASRERYPVLYMQDGQNLFDPAAAFDGVAWGVGRAAQELILSGQARPFIVVAPYNTSARTAEYTPVPDPEDGGGKGELYARFLIDELKPYVDAAYRTRPGPEDTAVAGSSLGGLIALHLALTRPDVFSRVAALSPSLWWSDRELTRRVAASGPLPRPKMWVDMGTREGANPAKFRTYVKDLRRFAALLVRRGWRRGETFAARIVKDGEHDERSWAARVSDVLRFLFPPET